MMMVWRIRGKLAELYYAVLSMTVVHNMHTHEQLLSGFVFV